MAATQAQTQQNDVKDQPPISANNSFTNGTDGNNCRTLVGSDVIGAKGKKPIRNSISVDLDMSQYRESGPPVNNSEHNANSSEDGAGKISNTGSEKQFPHNPESSGGEVNFGKPPPDGGQNMQNYGLAYQQRTGYPMHGEGGPNPMHMGEGMQHHQANSYGHYPNVRHPYPGPKGARPPGPVQGFNQGVQRFMGQNPPTATTPTLNQLLQSSNSVHRYQNSYGDYGSLKPGEQPQPTNMGGYNQGWPPRPMAPYPQQPYRQQPPPGSRGYTASPGGSYPPASPSPQQYPPQQYRHPYQLGGSVNNNGSIGPGGPERVGSGSWSPGPQGPPSQGGPASGPHSQEPPSPQQQPAQQQQPQQQQQPPQQQQHQTHPQQQQQSPQQPLPSPQQQQQQHQQQQQQQQQQQEQQQRQQQEQQQRQQQEQQQRQQQQQQQQEQQQRQQQEQQQRQQQEQQQRQQQEQQQRQQQEQQQRQQQHQQQLQQQQQQQQQHQQQQSQQQPPPPQQQPPQPQPSPQPHQPLPPQQGGGASTPRASEQSPTRHAPDQGDLTGQNSNDSSSGGGPAPGTPNSQGMRPTPSPTGSSGSRSMSPAVGQQSIAMPPRPSSGQSDSGNGPTSQHGRMSHSPMTNQATPPLPIGQGGYPGAGSPHIHNYKMGPHQMPPHPPPQSQQMPPYSPQGPPHQYQTNYPVRGGPGMGYSGPGGYQGPPGGMPPGSGPPPQSQYPPRGPIPNHVQYPPSPYQHKVGYGSQMPPSPGSYNSHGSMGPPAPHHPGMPPPPPPHHDSPMPPPPPASTPNQHDVHDPTITTTNAGSGPISNVTSSGPPGPPGPGSMGVTSIVTTGPDGAALDEASQQSTLSNASAASGDDGACTPGKSRKDGGGGGGMMGYHSHSTTPQSTVPSPGAASHILDEYPDNSPTWSRTPASPVFNSHVPQDLYRPKKQHDSLSKLYEMDDSHDRRIWLDKLLHFMDERGSPITVCPTISKNPLDLYRLYHYVKERGGFMEVCKVTKNKIWKDIAGLLGIGASSSAAYTLRKHYTKNLLPYECHFDRGGIDPQPIINQVEATSKKKGAKAAPVPSPGSSNSQDSFQGPGGGGMDGYGGYGYGQEYNNQQRPPSQTNQGMPPSGNYQGQPGGAYNQPYGDQYGQQYPGGPYPPTNRPMYPPYGAPEPDGRVFNQASGGSSSSGGPPCPPTIGSGSSSGPVPPNAPQDYNRYSMGPGSTTGPGVGPPGPSTASGGYSGPGSRGYPPQVPPPGSPSPSGTPPSQQVTQGPPGATPPAAPPPQQQPYQTSGPPPPQSDYYNRPDGYAGGPAAGYPPGPPGAPNKNMPPPAAQPRRHPDFVKDNPQAPFPGFNQQRPQNMYPGPGWSNSNSSGFRGQFPGAGSPGPQWVQGPSRPGAPPNQTSGGQWGPQPPFPPNQPPQQGGWGSPAGQSPALRPPIGGPRPFRPDSKQPFPPHAGMPPHPNIKGPGMAPYGQPGTNAQVKRELVFPVDSVEATTPVLYKRRRLNKADVAPVDAWRIMMALKSGLLAETCWALDVLNILLFDDSTVAYFGLLHLPGLMDILLEHMRKALTDMLEPAPTISPFTEVVDEVTPADLGAVTDTPDPSDRVTLLRAGDFTYKTRKGKDVTIATDSEDIFVTSTKRSWDTEDPVDEAEQLDSSRYIISCFRAEFGNIPFVRNLEDVKKADIVVVKEETEPTETVEDKKDDRKPEPSRTRKKSKTLSDVISRIKKEPVEEPVEERSPTPPVPSPPVATPALSPSPGVKEEPPNTVKSEPEETNDSVNSDDRECKIGIYNIRDPAGTLKRRRIEDYEDECYTRDEASLYLVSETQDYVARRCICLSTILRNLTFVPGNEIEFSKNGMFLGLVGKLLLLHHEHPPRIPKQRKYDREEEPDFADCCSSLQGDNEWWWEFLHHMRENALVSIANIAGQVDLGLYPEDISRPILDGLLHWAVCPAAQGQDPFPTVSPSSSLSPQRLALEALCKLCVTDSNVDLVIATPPYCRLERLAAVLTRLLCRSEEQVLREFAVNLLYYLGAADSGMARTIATQNPCVSQLVGFIEQAEQSAMGVANQHGLSALRDNPDCMGTSLDMLRRAARTLLHLAAHPDNWPLFLQQEQRLLTLVMSQILDQQVASIIAMVLFQVSRASSVT